VGSWAGSSQTRPRIDTLPWGEVITGRGRVARLPRIKLTIFERTKAECGPRFGVYLDMNIRIELEDELELACWLIENFPDP
jgi:hypothetical protein